MSKEKRLPDISNDKLEELARTKSFEDFEKEYGIKEISFEAGQDGYPTSNYYKSKGETEKQIVAKRKRVDRFLKKKIEKIKKSPPHP